LGGSVAVEAPLRRNACSKTQKARLRMLSEKLNVILLMTDGAANHLHIVAPG
jgi:hypothetical protein